MNWLVRCVRGNSKKDDCQATNLEKHHGKKKKAKNNLEKEEKQRSDSEEESFSKKRNSSESKQKLEPADFRSIQRLLSKNQCPEESARHVAQKIFLKKKGERQERYTSSLHNRRVLTKLKLKIIIKNLVFF